MLSRVLDSHSRQLDAHLRDMFFCVNSGNLGVLTLVNRCMFMFMFVEIQFESLKGQVCLINSP